MRSVTTCGRWLLLLLCAVHGLATPAGFAIDFVGSRSVGAATAGSASAADASTVFYNPAGVSHLQRNEWLAGGDLFGLHDRFNDAGSTLLGGALNTPGNNGMDGIPTAFIPWIFGAFRLNDAWSVGLGIFAPFGLRTDYGGEFVGRYQNQVTSLEVIDVNPVVSYRLAPWISMGVGVNIERARLRLTQAIDFGSACAAALGLSTCSAGFGLAPGRSDGYAKLKGDDTAVGFSAGVLLYPFENSRLSVAFRSRVNHHFESAEQTFDVPPSGRAFLAAAGTPTALTGGGASTDLPLPARFSMGWNQSMMSDRLNLIADATLTKWDTFRSTVVTPHNPVTGAAVFVDQHYEDAWRFALGAEYEVNEQWKVRGGVAYDQTPIPREFVQAALPDRDRAYFSVGTSYGDRSQPWRVDLGYSYVRYAGRIPINRSTSNGDTLRGEFDVGGHVFATQVRYLY